MKQLFLIFTLTSSFIGCGSSNGNTSDATLTSYNNQHPSINVLSYADNTVDQIDIEHIKTIGLNGYAEDIAISEDGNYAYIASGEYGLEVLDISDPVNPIHIGTYDSYGYVNHVSVKGNIAYVSYKPQSWDDYERVTAYDISYPSDITPLGYREGFKNNNHQFAQCPYFKYYIIDNNLLIVDKTFDTYKNYELYNPNAIAAYENYLYVANGREGVTILKVDSPTFSTLVTP